MRAGIARGRCQLAGFASRRQGINRRCLHSPLVPQPGSRLASAEHDVIDLCESVVRRGFVKVLHTER